MPKKKDKQKTNKPLDICKQIDKLITDVENTETSKSSWTKLKALHKKISDNKKYPNREKLLKKLVPVISKYAQYDNKYTELKAEELA